MNKEQLTYRKYFLNDSQSRWLLVDTYGNKDKITLSTESGRLETRTCQYHFLLEGVEMVKISYKGRVHIVSKATVLKD